MSALLKMWKHWCLLWHSDIYNSCHHALRTFFLYAFASTVPYYSRLSLAQLPTMADHRIINVKADGDVMIWAGNDNDHRFLRVNSDLLSSVSQIFEDLIQFEAYENGMHDFKFLRLANDDPEAMTVICRILHRKAGQIKTTPKTNLLLTIAHTVRKVRSSRRYAGHSGRMDSNSSRHTWCQSS